MKVTNNLTNNLYYAGSFSANPKESANKDKNPISKTGERETLLKGVALTGLGVGARALWWLFEEGFEFESIYKAGSKIVDKNRKDVTGSKKELLKLGAFGALTIGFVAGIAAIYTLYKTPEVMYKGKVNAFVKGKDMDVYTKSNKIEVSLYDQMNEKAKNATPEEKEVLKQQYLKLRAAKNQTPDFVNVKNIQ